MTPEMRTTLLEKLRLIAELSEDVRFGQLLANLDFLVVDQTDESLRNIEDEQISEVMVGTFAT